MSVKVLLKRVLLICGILSSLLYVGTDILAATQWHGYSYTDQTISELMAIEAPTRPLMVPLFVIYSVLVIAFGLGVWETDSRTRALRITGVLLVVYGVVGFVGLLFFPMHVRGGAEMTTTDTMHMIVTTALVLSILLFIGFGATADGKWFRLYSIVTIVIVIVFGAWAGLDGALMAAQLPTPWMGVKERISVYGSLLWVLVLATILLRAEKRPTGKHSMRELHS
jgi:hypothetical protein